MPEHLKLAYNYSIASPALAYPTTVLIRDVPAAVIENTMSSLVPAVMGIDRPVIWPLLTVPALTVPVRDGVNVTLASSTGVNTVVAGAALYNCAVIATVVPVNTNVPVVLKNAARDVIFASRGSENRSGNSVRSKKKFSGKTPCAEVPNAK